MRTTVFGPFFSTSHTDPFRAGCVSSTGIEIEWASPSSAWKLAVHRNAGCSSAVRFQDLVVAPPGLPFPIECPKFQVLESADRILVPLESILVGLFNHHVVNRSIFQILTELSWLVPLHLPVTQQITTEGLLLPGLENQGFRLNAVLCDSDAAYAEIVWQVAGYASRFHAGICGFPRSLGIDRGVWQVPKVQGVGQLLLAEMRKLADGRPGEVFSPSGRQLLLSRLSKAGPSEVRENAVNHKADEHSV
jgi:hypothetical protein